MAYTKQTWNNGEAGGTPISALRLQHIEDGLEASAIVADSASTVADAAMPKSGGTFTGEIVATSINTTTGIGSVSIGNSTDPVSVFGTPIYLVGGTSITGDILGTGSITGLTVNGTSTSGSNSTDAPFIAGDPAATHLGISRTGIAAMADATNPSVLNIQAALPGDVNLATGGGNVSVGTAATTMTVNGELVARGYRLVSRTVHTSTPAAFTKASYPWLRAIKVMCLGGGGGGGGAAATAAGQNAIGTSGAGGAYAETFITDIAGLASSINLIVGAAGIAGAAGAGGGTGGDTSFGTLCVAKGGTAGGSGGAAAVGTFAVGASAAQSNNSTGDFVFAGGASGQRMYLSATSVIRPIPGGNFLFPNALNAASASGTGAAGGSPGNSIYGVGGYAGINAQSQAAAVAGGIGTGGLMIVELYA